MIILQRRRPRIRRVGKRCLSSYRVGRINQVLQVGHGMILCELVLVAVADGAGDSCSYSGGS